MNQYSQGHPQRLSYIRRVYYRRKREERPLDLEHKNLFQMYLSFLDKGPHGNGTRIEADPEAGGFRMFISEFDERTETWRESGNSFVILRRTKKGPTLKTARKRSR